MPFQGSIRASPPYVRHARRTKTSTGIAGSGGGGGFQTNGSMSVRCCLSLVQLANPYARAVTSCASVSEKRVRARSRARVELLDPRERVGVAGA